MSTTKAPNWVKINAMEAATAPYRASLTIIENQPPVPSVYGPRTATRFNGEMIAKCDTEEHAQLIAKALNLVPELTEALKMCKLAVESTHLPPSARMEFVRDYAAPAIAKAEGRAKTSFRYATDSETGTIQSDTLESAYATLRANISDAAIANGATLWVADSEGNRITMGPDGKAEGRGE